MPVLVSLLMVIGAAVGVVLATTGGKPAAPVSSSPVPTARPASGSSAAPVVPLLAGNTDVNGAVPAVTPAPAASTRPVTAQKVAALTGLRQADLLVVAPFTLSSQVRSAVSRQPGVTSAEATRGGQGHDQRLGAGRARRRPLYLPRLRRRAHRRVQPAVAGRGRRRRGRVLHHGHPGQAVARRRGHRDRAAAERLRVVAFGTVGIGGVDAVVSDAVARSLGMPAANAIVVSAPPASLPALVNGSRASCPAARRSSR